MPNNILFDRPVNKSTHTHTKQATKQENRLREKEKNLRRRVKQYYDETTKREKVLQTKAGYSHITHVYRKCFDMTNIRA